MGKASFLARAAAMAAAPMLCGCAAIAGRGPSMVPIDTNPRGATVARNGYALGVTPCAVQVSPSYPILTVSLDGYATREIDVGTRSNWDLILIGSLLWTPIVEIVVDTYAEALNRVDERPVFLHLSTEPQPRWKRG